ncbi:MAG: tRNA (guanosine(37)-N1)-methyltransferase TrmD [Elusimicrobia bacterium RIFCSPLOWO2_12_FULL_59_9]|nr:MAG: tRNA (guanosine(37)-N1)-methyltransferase TrmD [Elusimicrobia bacterium RIFCSPLOWO2_12_FULL_59_9]
MRIDIVTLFPGMFQGPFSQSMIERARKKGLVQIHFVNPRDFSSDKHRKVDDRPYGGGPGMLLQAEPLVRAIESVRRRDSTVIFLSPQGAVFNQATAESLALEKHLILVSGHYEGVDARVLRYVDKEISIGDYVLTGGEIPSMVVVDALIRLIPGALGNLEGARAESLRDGLLEFPQYTRPAVWKGRRVPKILLSGNHQAIESWRKKRARTVTRRKRPDLLAA